MQTMIWEGRALKLLDQTKLPERVEYLECADYRSVGAAIKCLAVRGAPAIGAAAAFAFVLGAREFCAGGRADAAGIAAMDEYLRSTRPTAVNLFWALDKMVATARRYDNAPCGELLAALEKAAQDIYDIDAAVNKAIAVHGAALFTEPADVITHCNAGALATTALGTALGVIRQAYGEGRVKRVFADETRPLLQGARLTAFELRQDGIPVTLITDNMAGWVMNRKLVQAVIVGADRIAANGDTANKIGTYSVAILAKEHGIPFYVAAPTSTFDFTMATGDDIPIEQRDADEVRQLQGIKIAPDGVDVFNPAFDVTPHRYITGIITEYGVLAGDYAAAIKNLRQRMEK